MAFWESKRREQGDDISSNTLQQSRETTRRVVAGRFTRCFASYRQAGHVCDFEPELWATVVLFLRPGRIGQHGGLVNATLWQRLERAWMVRWRGRRGRSCG